MTDQQIQQYVQSQMALAQKNALYSTKNVTYHTHNGIDSPKLNIPSGSSSNISGSSTGSQNTIAQSSYVLIQSTNDFANGITWTGSPSYEFTVQTAGVYLIIGVIAYAETGTGYPYEAWIYKNGVALFSGYATATTTAAGAYPIATKIVNLAVGDTIQMYGYQAQNNPAGLYSSQTYINIATI
jgi:hypothetical protein